MRNIVLWGPVVAYMVGIFAVSSLSQVSLPGGTSDKSWHALAYMGLAVLIVRAAAGGFSRRVSAHTALLAALVAVVYGATDELHQSFVPGRSAEWYDLAADTAGAFVGAFAIWAWSIISFSRHDV